MSYMSTHIRVQYMHINIVLIVNTCEVKVGTESAAFVM